MREYYKAPVRWAIIKNVHIINNNVKYDRENIIFEKEVYFMLTRFGKAIRLDTKFPVTNSDDVDDIIINEINSYNNKLDKITIRPIQYVDYDELIPVDYLEIPNGLIEKKKIFQLKRVSKR